VPTCSVVAVTALTFLPGPQDDGLVDPNHFTISRKQCNGFRLGFSTHRGVCIQGFAIRDWLPELPALEAASYSIPNPKLGACY
jgi:hypothetical protein